MTTFLTTLRTLDSLATPEPWGCLDLRPVDVQRLSIMGADEDSIVARIENTVSARPLSHEDEANAAIMLFLRNHAAAIIGCVEALEEIKNQDWAENCLDPQWAARIATLALAALEEE